MMRTCDCGEAHNRSTYLNADTEKWLCAKCVAAKDQVDMAIRAAEMVKLEGDLRAYREGGYDDATV